MLTALSGAVVGYNLGVGRLGDWDEAIYAEVARELLLSRDFITMHWNFVPFYDKPPLLFWTTAASYQVFGVNELGARVPSALAGVATVVLTYGVARHYLSQAASALAGVVLLLCVQWTAAARYGTTDALLTLFAYLLVWAYLESRERPRFWILVGVAAGLGVMTKGAAGLVVPMAVGGAVVLDGRWRELGRREVLVGLAAALLVVLPWHLAAYLRGGSAFLSQYLGYHVFARAAEPIEGHTGLGLLTYVAYMRNQFFPWFYLVPCGALLLLRQRRHSYVLVLVPTVLFLVYTAVRSKWLWYMVPAYPALAVICAYAIEAAVAQRDRIAIAGVLVAAAGAVASIPNILGPYPRWWALPFAAVGLVAAAIPLARRYATLALVLFMGVVSSHYLGAIYPQERPWYIAPVRAQVIPLALVASTDHPAARLEYYATGLGAIPDTPTWPDLLFYSRRPVVEVHSPPDTDAIVEEDQAGAAGLRVIDRSGPYVYGRP